MSIFQSLNNVILPGARVPRIAGWDALKKYPMPRDSEGMFLDEDDSKNYLYMKRVELDGKEICARYSYVEDPVEEFDPNKYVTVKDFNEFREEIRNGFDSIKDQFGATANAAESTAARTSSRSARSSSTD